MLVLFLTLVVRICARIWRRGRIPAHHSTQNYSVAIARLRQSRFCEHCRHVWMFLCRISSALLLACFRSNNCAAFGRRPDTSGGNQEILFRLRSFLPFGCLRKRSITFPFPVSIDVWANLLYGVEQGIARIWSPRQGKKRKTRSGGKEETAFAAPTALRCCPRLGVSMSSVSQLLPRLAFLFLLLPRVFFFVRRFPWSFVAMTLALDVS